MQIDQTEVQVGLAEMHGGLAEGQVGLAKVQVGLVKVQVGVAQVQVGLSSVQIDPTEVKVGLAEMQEGLEELHVGCVAGRIEKKQCAGRTSRCGQIVLDCLISPSLSRRIGSPYQRIGRCNEARLGIQYHKANKQPPKRIVTFKKILSF